METLVVMAGIACGLIIVLTAILLPVLLLIVALRLIVRPGGKQDKEAAAAEARLMQEIHMGLTKMEERIEALETLLIDEQRKEPLK